MVFTDKQTELRMISIFNSQNLLPSENKQKICVTIFLTGSNRKYLHSRSVFFRCWFMKMNSLKKAPGDIEHEKKTNPEHLNVGNCIKFMHTNTMSRSNHH